MYLYNNKIKCVPTMIYRIRLKTIKLKQMIINRYITNKMESFHSFSSSYPLLFLW